MNTITIDRAVVEQALGAFRMCVPMDGKHAEVDAAFKALRAALAQERAEPVEPGVFTKEWCVRMAQIEMDADAEMEIGVALAQEQAEPQGCATEEDCTKQPWCRIRRECQRKQAKPAQEQAEPLNLSDRAVQRRLAAQWGYVPAQEQAVTDDMRSAVRWAPSSAYWSERLREFFGPDAREGIDALERRLAEAQEPDLSRCPQCNGPADNGHDRSVPPSPYLCTKCMAEPVQEPVVGWMDPESEDVVSAAQRAVWAQDFGVAGRRKAGRFTIPLRACLAQEQAEPEGSVCARCGALAFDPVVQQTEPLNLLDRAVQRRLAAQWGYVPAEQAEPAQEQAFHGFMSADGTQVDLCFTPSAPRSDGAYATAYYTAPPKAEPVQEPVAKCIDDICSEHLGRVEAFDHLPKGTLLYTIFPRRTMVPLTEEEIDRIHLHLSSTVGSSYKTVARAVEKASWEKNK